MNILQINSSARAWANGQGSQSTRLANELVERLRAAHPAATLTLRDLTADAASGAGRGRARRPVHAGRGALAPSSTPASRSTTR